MSLRETTRGSGAPMGAPVENSPAPARRHFVAAQALWPNVAPMLSRWLSCTCTISRTASVPIPTLPFCDAEVSESFSVNLGLIATHSHGVAFALLVVSGGTTSNAFRKFSRNQSRPRGHVASTNPAPAAGLPGDWAMPFDDLPAGIPAPISLSGPHRGASGGVGGVGSADLGRAAHCPSSGKRDRTPVRLQVVQVRRHKPIQSAG